MTLFPFVSLTKPAVKAAVTAETIANIENIIALEDESTIKVVIDIPVQATHTP